MNGRPVRPFLLLPTLLFVASAAAVAARGPADDPDPGQTPSPHPTGAEKARELVAAIAPMVEEIRGLRFKQAVSVDLADDATARGHFEARMKVHWPESRTRVEQDAYIDLGLLPERTSFKDSVLDALEEQAGGYYDSDRDTFVVLSDMPGSIAPVIVAHELTHALDDQTFHIDAMLEEAGRDSERAGGVAAVVEGSGTLVMTLYMVREMTSGHMETDTMRDFQESEAGQSRRLRASPQVVQRLLVGPYVLGMNFLIRGNLATLSSGVAPKDDLDRAFRDPPASWEQVLHPEKYWNDAARDLPRRVTLPDFASALGEGWVLEGQGELGEMILAILTGPRIDVLEPANFKDLSVWTNKGAAGWGGDRWQLYRAGDATVAILATLWDTARDAREFRDALAASPGRTVVRRGDAVVVVAGAAGDRAPALARQVLRALRAQAAPR